MEQKIKINAKEIMEKLTEIKKDIEYIKECLIVYDDKQLEDDMISLEEAGLKDIEEFNERYNL